MLGMEDVLNHIFGHGGGMGGMGGMFGEFCISKYSILALLVKIWLIKQALFYKILAASV